jgi:hypothetical protein
MDCCTPSALRFWRLTCEPLGIIMITRGFSDDEEAEKSGCGQLGSAWRQGEK